MQARLATEQQKLAQASENSLSRSPTKPPVDGAQAGQAEPTHDMQRTLHRTNRYTSVDDIRLDEDDVRDDVRDLSWATVLKRTFEQYLREESPNMVSKCILKVLHIYS
jgi:WD repeat and SOF domain-containing protein 1